VKKRSFETGARFVDALGQDVRFGLRVLRRNPGFTVTALLTLALGIGANTAIFSVIYGVLLRPLPYKEGHRLVVLNQQARLNNVNNLGFSVKEFQDYRDQNKTMEMVEHHAMSFILFGRKEPERVQTSVVSANFFDVLGVKPILGRTFVADDEKPGGDAVLVLSNKYWKQSHGADPNIVGTVFRMNNRPHTVIGVLPPVPEYPSESDVYMPTANCPFRSATATIENRRARLLSAVFGRLKPGVEVAQAQADVAGIAANMQQAYPDVYPKHIGYAAQLDRLDTVLTKEARPTFLILLGTTALVLLIVCANVANLNLARLLQRQSEVAVRTALGASRGRLVTQMLTESLLLSMCGGALGLLLAWIGLPLLTSFAGRFTTRTAEIQIDSSVLLFTLVLSACTGLAFGVIPALSSAFDSRKSLVTTLKESGDRSSSGAKNRVRGLLVAAQVAISFTLLTAAALMLQSMIRLQRVNPGFNPENVFVMRLQPNWSRFNDPTTVTAQFRDYFRRMLDSVNQQPGVVEAAISSTYPLNPAGITRGPNNVTIQLEGRPRDEANTAAQVDPRAVSPAYFHALDIPLLRGRMFTDGDDDKAPRVAIVNDAAARGSWGAEDPIGKRFSFDNGATWITVVGVVGNVKQYGLDKEPSQEIYGPIAQTPFGSFLVVKTNGAPLEAARLMRDVVHKVDAETAIDQVRTLQQALDDSVASPHEMTWLLGVFALLALFITAAGLTGVMALAVTQRTREIGIRIALGASRVRILTMMMRQALTLMLLGLAAGLVGALMLNRVITSLLFATPAVDAVTFAVVACLLTLVGAAACLVPALNATGIDPTLTLRKE
jgi:putative ABC transport system permease protein